MSKLHSGKPPNGNDSKVHEGIDVANGRYGCMVQMPLERSRLLRSIVPKRKLHPRPVLTLRGKTNGQIMDLQLPTSWNLDEYLPMNLGHYWGSGELADRWGPPGICVVFSACMLTSGSTADVVPYGTAR